MTFEGVMFCSDTFSMCMCYRSIATDVCILCITVSVDVNILCDNIRPIKSSFIPVLLSSCGVFILMTTCVFFPDGQSIRVIFSDLSALGFQSVIRNVDSDQRVEGHVCCFSPKISGWCKSLTPITDRVCAATVCPVTWRINQVRDQMSTWSTHAVLSKHGLLPLKAESGQTYRKLQSRDSMELLVFFS